MPQRWLTGDLQGYISWRLISRPGARAGEGKDDATCPAVNRKCHPLVMPITAALGHLPALTTLRLYVFCSDVRGRMAGGRGNVPVYQSYPAHSPRAPHALPTRSDGLYPAGSLRQPLGTGEISCGQHGESLLQLP